MQPLWPRLARKPQPPISACTICSTAMRTSTPPGPLETPAVVEINSIERTASRRAELEKEAAQAEGKEERTRR